MDDNPMITKPGVGRAAVKPSAASRRKRTWLSSEPKRRRHNDERKTTRRPGRVGATGAALGIGPGGCADRDRHRLAVLPAVLSPLLSAVLRRVRGSRTRLCGTAAGHGLRSARAGLHP